MEWVSLALFAVAVVGLGAAATVLLADWMPAAIAEPASEHGRFIGLGEKRSQTAAPRQAHVQAEAINVVRTSN